MRSPDTLFDVSLDTVESLFSQTGRGFYIPPYQRPFSWGRQEIDRFIDDLCIGLQSWIKDEDAVSFLGTLILLKDELFDQVEPAIRDQLPSEVLVVIDGQQRVTTLSLLSVAIHYRLGELARPLASKEFPSSAWLTSQVRKTRQRLTAGFELDYGYGDGDWRYYPRIIRAYVDRWSHQENNAIYDSPLARFLAQYIVFSRQRNRPKRARFRPEYGDDGGALKQVVAQINKHLKSIGDGRILQAGELLFANEHYLSNPAAQIRLFRDGVPEPLAEFAQEEGHKESRAVLGLMNTLAFASYFLVRCSAAITRPQEDRFAFDLFEALNTTGQQLTAYETFRPLVVKAENLSEYRNSVSHRAVVEIDDFVPDSLRYDKRANITHDILLPFAMAEDGTRLPKKLGKQRNWLRQAFDQQETLGAKRDFLEHLRDTVRFLRDCWRYHDNVSAHTHVDTLVEADAELALVCLDYLRRVKHEISIGCLVRFYSRVIADPVKSTASDFVAAVKAVAAFFTLYRWAFDTKGLPDTYTALMRRGGHGVEPFARSKRAGPVQASELTSFLRARLLERVPSKEAWVDRVKLRAVTGPLARFALYAALHDSTRDLASNQGLITSGKPGCLSMLTLARWCEQSEVEHVAPKTRSEGWDEAHYEGDNIELIGNLILLPKNVNGSVGNRSWAHKNLYYRVLASPHELPAFLDSKEVADLKLDLSALTPANMEVLGGVSYHAQLEPLARVEGEWTSELVQRRSERLASLLWDRLGPWLDLP